MHSTLVGRHRELQTLVAACKDGAGAVFVRGDAGVGKSSLLDAALAQADLLGAKVLHARFNDLDRHVPYAGLRSALIPSLGGETDDEIASVGRAVQAALDLDLEVDPEDRLAVAFEMTRRVLDRWATDQMVVLALDDLHVADPDSVRVVGLLVAHLSHSRFTLLATLRPTPAGDGAGLAALVERLEREGLAHVLDVSELDLADTRAVVHGLLGRRPSDDVVNAIWEASAGNAYYVTEATRTLLDGDRLRDTEAGVDLVEGSKPISLSASAALLHRIFELGPEARTVLRLMAALDRIGLDRLDLIAEVTELDADTVDDVFDRLVAENLLQDVGDGMFRFAHPIIKATLYEDLGPAGRRRIHQRVAAVLGRKRQGGVDVPIGELAAHVSQAAEPGDLDAVQLLAQAGQEAARSAPLTAAEWLLRAADLLPPDAAQRGEILAVASRALLLAARAAAAAEVGRDALAALPPGSRAGRTAAVAVQALASLGRFDEALAVADAQLDADDRPVPSLQAMRARVLIYLDRFAEAEADLSEALAASGDWQTRSGVLGAMASCAYARGDLVACFRHLDEQDEHETNLGRGSRLASLVVRSSYLALSGSLLHAKESFASACSLSEEMGGSAYRAELDTTRGLIAWLEGDWDGVVEASRTIGVDPDRAGVYGVLVRIAELCVSIDRGQLTRARELAEEVSASRLGSSFATWAVARLDAALGDLDAARDAYIATLHADRATGRRSVEALLLASLVQVDMALGNEDGARGWADALVSVTDRSGPLALVAALRARSAVLGDGELAREAIRVAEANGLVVEQARGRFALGRTQPDPAEEWTAAYVSFRRLGAEPEMREVAAAMRQRGIAVPRAPTARSGGLTESEREMARLVHEGLTNRQIARLLFLSPKTIEVYLGRVFAKTGCANRLELALAVGQGRIDDLGEHEEPPRPS